jgi:hypothetical protein
MLISSSTNNKKYVDREKKMKRNVDVKNPIE